MRLALGSILILLVLGSVTMLYPFAMMLAGSTKSNADVAENRIIPGFLTSRDILWSKHVEGLFNESVLQMRSTYDSNAATFDRLLPPKHVNGKFADTWLAFLKQADLPPTYYTIGYLECPMSKSVVPSALRAFKKELSRQFGDDLGKLNKAMATDFPNWSSLTVIAPLHLNRRQVVTRTPLGAAIDEFSSRQPLTHRVYFSLEGFYREQFLRPQYQDIAAYNDHHHTHYASYRDVHLTRRLPGAGHTDAERKTREIFVRTTLNLLWIGATDAATPAYHNYLQAKYDTISALNRNYDSQYASFDQIPLPVDLPNAGIMFSDWNQFIQGWKDPKDNTLHEIPITAIHLHGLDFMFRDYLTKQFGSITVMNQRLGTHFADFASVEPPQEDLHYLDFLKRTGSLRWEFVTRNYRSVMDYIAVHGNAIRTTAIYCILAVLGALIVNPLAAYALSRYRPPSTYKWLLIMMLTMAFPPMVTQIPVFLMLRDLSMLNTFWALVLPGLASGYMIFLLKGFFDSLPQELYESAVLDGAGEVRIFLQITMSLSKPILAVIALYAFTAAYSNFIFALLICQDQNMWTITVWLYQLQTFAGPGIILASVTLAALPTLIVFVMCQNVIMQGIVVPVEK